MVRWNREMEQSRLAADMMAMLFTAGGGTRGTPASTRHVSCEGLARLRTTVGLCPLLLWTEHQGNNNVQRFTHPNIKY